MLAALEQEMQMLGSRDEAELQHIARVPDFDPAVAPVDAERAQDFAARVHAESSAANAAISDRRIEAIAERAINERAPNAIDKDRLSDLPFELRSSRLVRREKRGRKTR